MGVAAGSPAEQNPAYRPAPPRLCTRNLLMTFNFRIRPAQQSDADQICHILESLGWFPHLDGSSLSRSGITRQVAMCLADPSHCLLVAQETGGVLLGYVSLHRNPSLFLTSPEIYLAELFVHPEARGRGVGSSLLEEAEHWAQHEGCSRMMLINNRLRHSYLDGFYAKRGWREREDMANFVLPLHRPMDSDQAHCHRRPPAALPPVHYSGAPPQSG
eukprot:TRINITY_DN53059_c0_g3_i1.p2 TRINITY_DN53059_c0_g3~~TRINITY_DN53059_c0_g3_i1.p2  ORF type:complete len:216 (+),score=34.74 TRINITY_DN53059_c0_g3_i1:73-720(+)